MPGMPPQVVCYERADDIGFGVSGVVTRARGIRATFPDLDPAQIPMAAPVRHEKVVYLLDPIGASRRSRALRAADRTAAPAARRAALRARRLRAALDPAVPAQGRRPGPVDRPVHPVGRQPAADDRRGADLAGHTGGRGPHRGPPRLGRPADRPGHDGRQAGGGLHARHGHPRRAHGRRRRAGRHRRPATRRRARHARRAPPARLGGRHEDGRGPARACRARAGNRPPHARLSGAGDLRLPLRARRAHGVARASSSRRGSTARCAPRTATCSTGCCTRTCGGISRAAGCARGARSRCRNRAGAASRSWPATATRASARAPAAPTSSPAPAWTKRGPPARCSPRACSSCSRPGSRSRRRTSSARTSRGAARAGSSRKGGSRSARATASSAGSSRAWSAWRSPG